MILGKPIRWWLALGWFLGALGLAVPIYAGFFGELHPGFDTISHFRLHLAAAMVLAALLLLAMRGWRRAAAGLLVLALLPVTLTVGLPSLPGSSANAAPEDAAVYRMLHLNLRFDNPDPAAVFSMIGREKPDVITLAEVSDMWEPKLSVLDAAYPYRVRCPQDSRNGGVALLSRRPFAEGGRQECHDRGSLALATIDFGGQAVEIAALHLGWPWPFGQDWQVGNIVPVMQTLGSTAIVGGDFNAAPWSVMARRVAAGGELRFAGWTGPTWLDRRLPQVLRPYIGLPIDHVLSKGAVVAQAPVRLAPVGSDHLPVLTEFRLLREEGSPPVQQALFAPDGDVRVHLRR